MNRAPLSNAVRAWVSRTRYLVLSFRVINGVLCDASIEGPDKNSRSVWLCVQSLWASVQASPFSAQGLMQTMAPHGERTRRTAAK
jgi:hypothetical protein